MALPRDRFEKGTSHIYTGESEKREEKKYRDSGEGEENHTLLEWYTRPSD